MNPFTDKKMNQVKNIIISTQAEFDALPDNLEAKVLIQNNKGEIVIDRYLEDAKIVVFDGWVKVKNNANVTLIKGAMAEACDRAWVKAYDQSKVIAFNSSEVHLYNKSRAEAYNNAVISAVDKRVTYVLHNDAICYKLMGKQWIRQSSNILTHS